MVTGFVHHVVAGFAAKGKLMEMRLDSSFLVFSVNINVSIKATIRAWLSRPK